MTISEILCMLGIHKWKLHELENSLWVTLTFYCERCSASKEKWINENTIAWKFKDGVPYHRFGSDVDEIQKELKPGKRFYGLVGNPLPPLE